MELARYIVEWPSSPDIGPLRLVEPTGAEVAAAAATLASFYNEPYNLQMMAHSGEMSPAEVEQHYADLRESGSRPFLLYLDEALMGDGDLRRIESDRAELAFLVGARAAQGRGLGTRYGIMLTAFAFSVLGVERVYASILPHNHASRRAFEKMGYRPDDSPAARGYADEDDDVTVSIERHAFTAAHVHALGEIAFRRRPL